MNLTLTDTEKDLLLYIARHSVEKELEGRTYVPPVGQGNLLTEAGIFVTIHNAEGGLRGCIGQLYSKSNLIDTVKEVVCSSAFHDPRFSPVQKEELRDLTFEISIISPFEHARPEDVILGTHGIYLKCGYNTGLLLPQVAVEHGWSRTEFLDHGCRKAGLPQGYWQDSKVELYVFTALVFKEK